MSSRMPTVRRLVGMRIKDRRQRQNLSPRALAELLGVNRAAVSDWEKGRWLPSLERLWALAYHLNISVGALLEPTDGWTPKAPESRSGGPDRGPAGVPGGLGGRP